MTEEAYKKFLKQLKNHEGEELVAYLDTLGVLTVGVGHNCIASPVPGVTKPGDTITQEQSDELFKRDSNKHIRGLDSYIYWIKELNYPRQAVLYNMAYNLGVKGLLGFRNTLAHVEDEEFDEAAISMLKSKWASQVGNRAKQLAKQMSTGEWQGV